MSWKRVKRFRTIFDIQTWCIFLMVLSWVFLQWGKKVVIRHWEKGDMSITCSRSKSPNRYESGIVEGHYPFAGIGAWSSSARLREASMSHEEVIWGRWSCHKRVAIVLVDSGYIEIKNSFLIWISWEREKRSNKVFDVKESQLTSAV